MTDDAGVQVATTNQIEQLREVAAQGETPRTAARGCRAAA